MTEQQKALKSAESFVRKVLADNFGQKTPPATVRDVALKVARTLPQPTTSGDAKKR